MSLPAVFYEGAGRFRFGTAELVPPGPGEVRLEVAYCGICGTDVHIAHGAMDHRVRPPQVIGHEMSGVVAELGEGVAGFEPGEPVVVRPLDTRGEVPADRGLSHIGRNLRFMGIDTPGAFQRSWTVPAFTLHHLPAGVDLRLAALTEPLAVACHDVRRADLAAGESAVVLGGGPIGLLVALVARHAGARVVVSELNATRLGVARSLGFDAVTPSELHARVHELTDEVGADVVFEVSGAASAVASMTELAALRGRIVIVAIHPEPRPVTLFDFFFKELELRGARVYEPEDYERAIALLTGGELPLERLISRVEPLERLPAVFHEIGDSVKVLVDCRE